MNKTLEGNIVLTAAAEKFIRRMMRFTVSAEAGFRIRVAPGEKVADDADPVSVTSVCSQVQCATNATLEESVAPKVSSTPRALAYCLSAAAWLKKHHWQKRQKLHSSASECAAAASALLWRCASAAGQSCQSLP